MNFWKLYIASFMSILKLLLITALGAFLAHDRFNILRENARKHLNAVSIIGLGFLIPTNIKYHTPNKSYKLS